MHFPSAHFADFLLRPKFHICSSHFLNICRCNERWSWWGCWWLWRWWSLHRHCFDHCLGWLATFIWIGDEIFIGPFSRCFSRRGPFFQLSPLFVPSRIVFWVTCMLGQININRTVKSHWLKCNFINITVGPCLWLRILFNFYRYHRILITTLLSFSVAFILGL